MSESHWTVGGSWSGMPRGRLWFWSRAFLMFISPPSILRPRDTSASSAPSKLLGMLWKGFGRVLSKGVQGVVAWTYRIALSSRWGELVAAAECSAYGCTADMRMAHKDMAPISKATHVPRSLLCLLNLITAPFRLEP